MKVKNNHRAIGTEAELMAQTWFKRQHYRIVETNWYHEHREVDLIVEDSKYRVFVEVKYQSANATVFPESKVNKQKQQFLKSCARVYNSKFPTQKGLRFDVLGITESNHSVQMFHLKDAFFGRISYKSSNRLSHFYDTSFNLKRF